MCLAMLMRKKKLPHLQDEHADKYFRCTYKTISKHLNIDGYFDYSVDVYSQLITLRYHWFSLLTTNYIHIRYISGECILNNNVFIMMTVSYDAIGEQLNLIGELNNQINTFSDSHLAIHQCFVTFTKLTGNIKDDFITIVLSGSISEGHVCLIYQTSPAMSSVGLAADKKRI